MAHPRHGNERGRATERTRRDCFQVLVSELGQQQRVSYASIQRHPGEGHRKLKDGADTMMMETEMEDVHRCSNMPRGSSKSHRLGLCRMVAWHLLDMFTCQPSTARHRQHHQFASTLHYYVAMVVTGHQGNGKGGVKRLSRTSRHLERFPSWHQLIRRVYWQKLIPRFPQG